MDESWIRSVERTVGTHYTVGQSGTWPLVLAWPEGEKLWGITCPYCPNQHTHGAGPGHRVSHCDIVNERTQRGYWLTDDARLAGLFVSYKK